MLDPRISMHPRAYQRKHKVSCKQPIPHLPVVDQLEVVNYDVPKNSKVPRLCRSDWMVI